MSLPVPKPAGYGVNYFSLGSADVDAWVARLMGPTGYNVAAVADLPAKVRYEIELARAGYLGAYLWNPTTQQGIADPAQFPAVRGTAQAHSLVAAAPLDAPTAVDPVAATLADDGSSGLATQSSEVVVWLFVALVLAFLFARA